MIPSGDWLENHLAPVTRSLLARAYGLASERQRAAILWDRPFAEREAEFWLEVDGADYALAYVEEESCAIAWAKALCAGSATGHIHFFFSGDAQLEGLPHAARYFRDCCLERFQTLLALVPAAFIGAARLLKQLGFERRAYLPRALRVNGRLTGGVIWILERGPWKVCAFCGNSFKPRNEKHIYCSGACRLLHYSHKNKNTALDSLRQMRQGVFEPGKSPRAVLRGGLQKGGNPGKLEKIPLEGGPAPLP